MSKKSSREEAIRSAFTHKFCVDILGYVPFGSSATKSISEEHQNDMGRADDEVELFNVTMS